MSRYVNDLPTALSRGQAGAVITEYLKGEGFVYGLERGEMVWRKGIGWLSSPQFMKVEPADGAVHLEAWMAGFAFLPGVYAGEQGLDGVYGWAVKAALKARVMELERRLETGAAELPIAAAGADVTVGLADGTAARERATDLRQRLGTRTDKAIPAPATREDPAALPMPAGWHGDPAGRHQSRYWNGAAWTDVVADDGVQSADPL
ncbi:MAG TPA: DUF2510 domain-containing protein [Coriobacteriia bacterium]